MRLLLLGICLLPLLLTAETYRYTDPDTGAVVFTDQPPANRNAEKIRINEPAVVSPYAPTTPAAEDPDAAEATTAATSQPSIKIISPEADATFRNIGGQLQVVASLDNASSVKEYFIRYKLDDKIVQESTKLAVTLDDVYRGTHQLVAELVSLQGQVLAASAPVTFYVKQTSVR